MIKKDLGFLLGLLFCFLIGISISCTSEREVKDSIKERQKELVIVDSLVANKCVFVLVYKDTISSLDFNRMWFYVYDDGDLIKLNDDQENRWRPHWHNSDLKHSNINVIKDVEVPVAGIYIKCDVLSFHDSIEYATEAIISIKK